jgi:hypothetical protein
MSLTAPRRRLSTSFRLALLAKICNCTTHPRRHRLDHGRQGRAEYQRSLHMLPSLQPLGDDPINASLHGRLRLLNRPDLDEHGDATGMCLLDLGTRVGARYEISTPDWEQPCGTSRLLSLYLIPSPKCENLTGLLVSC